MATTVLIRDEFIGSQEVRAFSLEFLTTTLTARELIRRRVFDEVQRHNLSGFDQHRGFFESAPTELMLNGQRSDRSRAIDWERQFSKACDAFRRQGFFLLVDDRQIESLDEEITLRVGSEVSFVKLTPLVGG